MVDISGPARADLPYRNAVVYARVSSKEQEKEGFSIPAQLKLLKEYASAQGFTVLQEYVDVETAKQTGRAAFGEMVAYLKRNPKVRIMLVEKTDRLYRNLKDWVTVDELGVEIHFPKEGVVLSRDSRSSEKFMHGIKVLMAKNYIDNLAEEARKGMQEKAEQGIWPTKTPLGYRNITASDGKKIIATDPAIAPLITRLFETYASGTLSLKEVARTARTWGLRYPRTGAPVPVSTVHTILRNRLYSGEFDWNGRRFTGRHEAIVSPELWERVQDVLDGRNAHKTRRSKHDFAFSGLITCGHCGCALVGEIKKQRYIYYHCSGFRGKCPEPYVREEVIERQFTETLGRLTFDDEVLAWVRIALRESHTDEKREHEAAIMRLQDEYNRLQSRIDTMYIDKLDGRIDAAYFDRMAAQWRDEQARCLRDIEWHQNANRSYLEEGIHLLELARSARQLFERQEPREKRRLLNFMVSNCSWKGGALTVRLLQPFDLLANAVEESASTAGAPEMNLSESEIWLGDLETNLARQMEALSRA
jgi:DNA invertase Pin-like site-specific DNA recombinase